MVVSTWPSSWPLKRFRKAFHSAMPISAMTRAAIRMASAKGPPRHIVLSATYPPSR
jgi:hypothetical protein